MDITSIVGFLSPIISSFAATHPVVMTILVFMGVCRAIFKPLFTFLQAVADATPGDWDNKLLAQAQASPIFKGFQFVLDILFSIKINPPKKD